MNNFQITFNKKNKKLNALMIALNNNGINATSKLNILGSLACGLSQSQILSLSNTTIA